MTQPVLTFVISFALLLTMSAVFLFFYFRSQQEELSDYWFFLREKLHLRLDKLPALLEITGKFTKGQEMLLKDIIALRSQSWNNHEANRAKVATELNLSAQLHQVWDLGKNHQELAHHSIFLEAQAEFKDLGQLIEQEVEKYNERVRKFNKKINFLLFRPFILLFRLSKKHIFEFEP